MSSINANELMVASLSKAEAGNVPDEHEQLLHLGVSCLTMAMLLVVSMYTQLESDDTRLNISRSTRSGPCPAAASASPPVTPMRMARTIKYN